MIISTLYRYFLEDFSVEIFYDGSSMPDQIFDLTIEGVLNARNENNPEYRAYRILYGNGKADSKSKICNLYGAPWIVDRERYTKQRVDMFIAAQEGYINGTKVDYRSNGLKNHLDKRFTEEFIQYTFDGETISSEEFDEIESIVGSIRAQSKIIIRYKELSN